MPLEGSQLRCVNCGELTRGDELLAVQRGVGSELWCPDCVDADADECGHCDQLVAQSAMTVVITAAYDEEYWCEACYEAESTRCHNCGRMCDTAHISSVENAGETQYWCSSCCEADALACERCATLVSADETHTVDDEVWCQHCVDYDAGQCVACMEMCRAGDMLRMHDGDYICQDCYESGEYFTCSGCDEIHHMDYIGFDNEDTGEVFCDGCSDNAPRHRESIHRWNYRPVFVFYVSKHENHTLSHKPLCMGVETELEVRKDYSVNKVAMDFLDRTHDEFFYLMTDSSINRGFEVATQPFSWSWAK